MTQYTVTVRTGDRDSAGTDADVFICLFGDSAVGGPVELDNADDNFERGQTDFFTVELPDVGDIQQIEMRHDNSGHRPGWFLEDVRVSNDDTGQEWIAQFHRWLAVDEEDGAIDVVVPARLFKGE